MSLHSCRYTHQCIQMSVLFLNSTSLCRMQICCLSTQNIKVCKSYLNKKVTVVYLCNYRILVNNQLDAQFFFRIYIYIFIPNLYMFRAPLCSSSGESVVLIRRLVYVTLYVGDRLMCRCGWSSIQTCIPDGHLQRVTYTRCRINTIDSPDHEHGGVRNI